MTKTIDGFAAALIITAPSLRAAAAAIPGIGRTRAAQLREQGPGALAELFSNEEAQRIEVQGRIKRHAPEAAQVAIELARALWRVARLDSAHALEVGVCAESRHIVSGAYSYKAEAATVRGSLRWAPGHAPTGEIEYRRDYARSVSHGVGWERRITTTGDKETGARLKALKVWGGTITLREW